MTEDPRKAKLRRGLEQLTDAEIRRLLAYREPMVYEDYNYDERTGRW